MTGYAGTPREARSAFISPYPFEMVNGGEGVSLSLTTASGRAAMVGDGRQVLVSNLGYVVAHLAFGNSSVVATAAFTAIFPGIPYTLTVPQDATHVAGITADGATTVQITRGYGN
jgi:hypothetical protein